MGFESDETCCRARCRRSQGRLAGVRTRAQALAKPTTLSVTLMVFPVKLGSQTSATTSATAHDRANLCF